MPEYIDRVRGSRRKKIEEGIRKAGYIKTYVNKNSNKDFCIKTFPDIDAMSLGAAMGIDNIEEKRILSKRLRDKGGLPMDTARVIIEFLKSHHDINLNLKFDDYS